MIPESFYKYMSKNNIVYKMILNFGTQYEQVSVGDPCPLEPSALFQINSTNKGLLPPRMTQAQRDQIVAPAAGLVVYNTSNNALEYFDGTKWVQLSKKITHRTTRNLEIGPNIINTLYNSPTGRHEIRARFAQGHVAHGSEIILKKRDLSINSLLVDSVIALQNVDIFCVSIES